MSGSAGRAAWTFLGFAYDYFGLSIVGPGGISYAVIARVPRVVVPWLAQSGFSAGGFTVSASMFRTSTALVPTTSLSNFGAQLATLYGDASLTYLPSVISGLRTQAMALAAGVVGYLLGSSGSETPSPGITQNISITNNVSLIDISSIQTVVLQNTAPPEIAGLWDAVNERLGELTIRQDAIAAMQQQLVTQGNHVAQEIAAMVSRNRVFCIGILGVAMIGSAVGLVWYHCGPSTKKKQE